MPRYTERGADQALLLYKLSFLDCNYRHLSSRPYPLPPVFKNLNCSADL